MHCWSPLGVKDKMIQQKHFPAETLQRVKRTDTIVSLNSELFVHHLGKDVSNLPNRTLAALKLSSAAVRQLSKRAWEPV